MAEKKDKQAFVFMNVWYESSKVLCKSRAELGDTMLALVEFAMGIDYKGSNPVAKSVIIQAAPALKMNEKKWKRKVAGDKDKDKDNDNEKLRDLDLYENDK